jgi:cardiolipin synthase (CMP-forming)
MRNLPNAITLLRLALVPAMAYYAATGAYGIALPIFLIAALSDLADGYLARRFKLVSKVGALLDPIADKLNMFVATVVLAWQDLMPMWLAAAIVGRDVVIVVGALAYRLARGRLEIRPTQLSKANTFIEFAVLLLVMATAAGWIDTAAWIRVLFAIVFVTVLASGTQYVWLWGRKAMAQPRTP